MLRGVLHFAQLIILFSLAGAVTEQTWYVATLEADYTDGLPEGASLAVEVEVDQESADGSLNIDGYLTYKQWQTTRNDTTIESDADRSVDAKPLSDIQEEVPLLATIAAALGLLLFAFNLAGLRFTWILGVILSLLVLWIILQLVINAPLGYLAGMDFDGEGKQEGESMVHESTISSQSYGMGATTWQFTTSGYDLGLADESELDSVIASPPGEDHRSYIEMQGEVNITWGDFIVELAWSWLILFLIVPSIISLRERCAIDGPNQL